MKNFIKRLFNKTNDEPISFEFNGSIRFTLKIESLDIGYLEIKDGKWIFQYSEDFKNQDSYRRLAGFSDLDKAYESEVLWPFFKIRIPGLKQPMIQEILEKENLSKENEAMLLKRFGRISMSNPYILDVS